MTTVPVWMWVVGVVILGAVMVYGIMNNRRRTLREKTISQTATRDLYEREDRSA